MKRMNCFTWYINMYMVKTWNIGPDNNDFVETKTRSFATKIMKCIFFSRRNSLPYCCQIALYICYTRYNATCFKENAASLFRYQQNCKIFALFSKGNKGWRWGGINPLVEEAALSKVVFSAMPASRERVEKEGQSKPLLSCDQHWQ